MRTRRVKVENEFACYHCMSRTVNGERFFGVREKEVLRKMLWRVADYSGVEVLTYALMNNHFHILIRVPPPSEITDAELMRRWRVLYPKPTKYEAARAEVMERLLQQGGEEAEAFRRRHLARMHDVSAFMKTLKQRFTTWFNASQERYGPLWSDRFKSVLVEGRGNPLQTMAAYIDLNPVRAGLVKDPKDYRFCGYAEAVAGNRRAGEGLRMVWAAYADGVSRASNDADEAMRAHRRFLFAKGSDENGGIDRKKALQVLEREDGVLPKSAALRCRVRYFTDGVILGSDAFVRKYVQSRPASGDAGTDSKLFPLKGAEWGDLSVPIRLRREVFH